MPKRKMVKVENVNVPGYTSHVDAEKYEAMREAMLQVLPKEPPGLTQREMMEVLAPILPDSLWPQGQKAMWWAKTVQLDLEAKGIVKRRRSKPLRWHLA